MFTFYQLIYTTDLNQFFNMSYTNLLYINLWSTGMRYII